MKQKKDRQEGRKKYGADLHEDYDYSKKLLGTASGAGVARLGSSMYAPSQCYSL